MAENNEQGTLVQTGTSRTARLHKQYEIESAAVNAELDTEQPPEADPELDAENPKSSRPSIVREVCLQSEQAQRVYKRYFSQVDHALFSISVISRAHGHDRNAQAIEQKITLSLEQLHDKLRNDNSRITALRKSLQVREQEEMTRPITVRAKISSHLALSYLQLLQQMDDFLCKFEPLVILGEIAYNQRQAVTYAWQQDLIAMARQIRTYSDELRLYHKNQSK